MPAVRRSPDPLARLRAWWFRRQGLVPATRPKTIDECIRTAGWLTTSGSPNLYVSIRARMPGASREAVDRTAMDGTAVVEVPGGHGRPAMVVPRSEAALSLRLHLADWEKHAASYFRTGRGPTEAAFNGLCSQVARALDEGPLSSGEVRARVTHRDAGELLAGALANLAIRGIARRFPSDARLDSPKYLYELRHPDDRPDLSGEGDHAAVVAKATSGFLRRHGPATLDELARWGALTKGELKIALGSIGAEPIEVAGWTKQAWLAADDASRWRAFKADDGGGVALLPYRDPFVYVRRPPAVLASKADGPVLDMRYGRIGKGRIGEIESVNHHVVVAAGEMVGLWEYDPGTGRVVTRLWAASGALKKQVADAADDTAAFIRTQIGDFKLSAVDPQQRRTRRLAFCRAR